MSATPEAPEGQVADAVPRNWVDTYAPAWSRPYLRLSRADRPIGVWLLYLPCIWGVLLASLADPAPFSLRETWIIIGCGLGAWLMRGAGCTWNDIADRDFDKAVARTRSRPIPSGQVTVPQAFMWMSLQCLLALIILLSFYTNAVYLGLTAIIPVAIYPFAKRFTWWPQIFLGIAFNWGVLVAWTAQRSALESPAILLYAAGIAWTLFYDTIYAHQDREYDALIGIRSTARLFGNKTHAWLWRFLVASVGLMAIAIILTSASGNINTVQILLSLAGVCLFGLHMTRQIRRLDINDTGICLRLFRSNREAGLLPALFLAIALFL